VKTKEEKKGDYSGRGRSDTIPNFETSTPAQNGEQSSPFGTATGIRGLSGDERQTLEEK